MTTTPGSLAIVAGVVLLVSGPVTLWRARRTGGSRRRRYLRRALASALGALVGIGLVWFVVFPIGFTYGYTHVGRSRVDRRISASRTRPSPSHE